MKNTVLDGTNEYHVFINTISLFKGLVMDSEAFHNFSSPLIFKVNTKRVKKIK
jgi:hypothetical protein